MFEEKHSTVHKSTSLETLNQLLENTPVGNTPAVLFLLGSSGCGKTYLSEALKNRLNSDKAEVLFFDSIGVPSESEMIERCGSGEQWQRETTHAWIREISEKKDKALVVFEGQYRPAFVTEVLDKHGINNAVLAVVTCDERAWIERLEGPRKQQELVTDDMRNWAKFLREETIKLGGHVVDTSASDLEVNLAEVASLAIQALQGAAPKKNP